MGVYIRNILAALSLMAAMIANGQVITTFAGNGTAAITGDGGSALSAGIALPVHGCFDKNGNYYFVGGISSDRVRMVDIYGNIHTIAGGATGGFGGDGGLATLAQLSHPSGAVVDGNGNIFIADYGNRRIRKVDGITHIITTIAGNGTATSTGDGGPATDATLVPTAICMDKFSNIYVADGMANKVRKIDATGMISTFAGNGGSGFSGDGGPATAAEVPINPGICADSVGNIYLACERRIRKVNVSTAIIETIAGTSSVVYAGDGIPATAASFSSFTIGMDTARNILYIADIGNDRVYRIDAAGIFHLVAGTGTGGYNGDGIVATTAQLYNPEGVATDACGNLYIADAANYRVRKVTFNPPTTPTITVTGVTTATVGTTVTVNAAVTGASSGYSIKWFKNSVLFSTTTMPVTTYVKGAGTDVITARVVPAPAFLSCYDSVTSEGHGITGVTVGIPPTPERELFSVYPNPVGGVLVVSSSGAVRSVVVTNIVGQQLPVPSTHTANEVHIDVANLPGGVYFVKVNEMYVQRFLKE